MLLSLNRRISCKKNMFDKKNKNPQRRSLKINFCVGQKLKIRISNEPTCNTFVAM